ncbi:hypothetical protein [Occallatibacter savannae]|uniref:hypothetical protein n=1 Tax=Occallatibacter savannae TaxID=1002691 RepID=UPI0013A54587|nr:hypothetical protein [Occallatibacter savannae]
MPVPRLKSLILVFVLAGLAAHAQDAGLVQRALANEARVASDPQHPMRFRLRKSSPRLTTTKEICETADGAVARLIAVNDAPLSQADEQREQVRLDQLLTDPSRQRRRKQSQDQDTGRAMKVLRSLPAAFLYQYAGTAQAPTGQVAKFTFKPNPKFDPPDLETQVLKQMTGELWIDPAQERVVRLDGRLDQDVDYAWGILGRLYKGGTIRIDQAPVGENHWRIVHFDMKMSARVVFKTRVFDTTEDESQFVPVAPGLHYQQAIAILRENRSTAARTDSR